MSSKYFWVLYNVACTPTLRRFTERHRMEKWVAQFVLRGLDNPDNWIDAVFEGELVHVGKTPVYDEDAETPVGEEYVEAELERNGQKAY